MNYNFIQIFRISKNTRKQKKEMLRKYESKNVNTRGPIMFSYYIIRSESLLGYEEQCCARKEEKNFTKIYTGMDEKFHEDIHENGRKISENKNQEM